MTLLTVYDGSSNIGGNKIHLEENGRGILLDFVMNFAKPVSTTSACRLINSG